ncbi:hypothetical protein [Rhodococcus sp. ADH]|uniref:hypothetical protein n=1 Tax=Rhodococcus sp. ADH TaxID=224843 RepID=UPI0012EDE07A|nr:hypothetical protein [Rhodococcus sp. ADH]
MRGAERGLFGPDLFVWSDLYSKPLDIGSEGTWVDGGHRAALIAAAGAHHVVIAD